MTGTGAQADPYIPTTLTEWLTAVGTNGAYVAMDSDINAADDPEYTGVITSTIVFRAVEVDGGGFALRGVTVDAPNAFQTSISSLLQNLDMRDIAHKRGSNIGNSFVCDTNYYWIIKNCRLSCKIDTTSAPDFCRHVSFIQSAIEAEYTLPTGTYMAIFDRSTFEKCTVLVKNARFSSFVNVHRGGAFVRSAFIFQNCTFGNGAQLFSVSITPRDYCYFAFVDSDISGTITCGDTSVGSVVAIDDQDVTVSVSNGWTRGTLAQMKDKDWLTSVGFLP